MPTVLLVDDSRVILLGVSKTLTEAGYRVVTAPDGEAALAELDRTTPDIVISDVNMPKMDGLQFVRALRARPALRSVPVLMLSTETDEAARQQARAAGANGWLRKPVTTATLLAVLQEHLSSAVG